MRYQKGEYVVYRNSDICVVGDVVDKCFDGKNTVEYLSLHQTELNGTIYVPVEKTDICIRPIMSKDRLLEIIDSMPQIKSSWIEDKRLRTDLYGKALKSGDYSLILPMMNAIYNERRKRNENGKNIPAPDEKAYNSVKRLLYNEIAYSFGIEPDTVEQFIRDRITLVRNR
ncbi:MAG: CarD family transcriptional regulator [Oscillospiraceae bacterium]